MVPYLSKKTCDKGPHANHNIDLLSISCSIIRFINRIRLCFSSSSVCSGTIESRLSVAWMVNSYLMTLDCCIQSRSCSGHSVGYITFTVGGFKNCMVLAKITFTVYEHICVGCQMIVRC